MADASLSESVAASASFAGSYFRVERAAAQDAQRVRVTLSAAALASSRASVGDALNPATWVVTELGTGSVVVVLAARLVDPSTFDVYLAAPFAPSPVLYSVGCPTLLSATGAVMGTPSSATFYGVGTVTTAPPPSTTTDLANKPTPLSDTVGGTLVIGPGGDYEDESGAALMRKLILRRLTTPRGGFFHLPDYGAGIDEKTLIHPSQLPAIQKDVLMQVESEPGITDVTASVTWDPAEGILYVTGKGVMEGSGVPVSFETPSSPASPAYFGGGYTPPPALPLIISFEASPPWTTGYGTVAPTAVVTAVGTGFSRVTSMDLVSDPLGQTIFGIPLVVLSDTSLTFSAADVLSRGGLDGAQYRVRLNTASGYAVTAPGFGFEVASLSVGVLAATSAEVDLSCAVIPPVGHEISGTITGLLPNGVNMTLTPDSLYANYYGVWVNPSDPDDVWAVGQPPSGEQCITHHWNGVAWAAVDNPLVTRILHGVWGASSGDVWAVGALDTLMHWDGTAWSTVPSPASGYEMQAVAGSSPVDVYAIGRAAPGAVILRWGGSAWSSVYTNPTQNLWSIWVNPSDPDDVWAVGGNGPIAFAVHGHGTSWTEHTLSSSANPLLAVWGSASDDVWAVGLEGLLWHWDGVSWVPGTSLILTPMAMWGSGAGNVWVGGRGGGGENVLYNWDGATWNLLPSLPILYGGILGISGDQTTGNFWAVGNTGSVSFNLIYFDNATYTPTDGSTVYAVAYGAYGFDGPLGNGRYKVTPYKAACTFTPQDASVPYSGTPVTGVDFVEHAPIVPTSTDGITWVTNLAPESFYSVAADPVAGLLVAVGYDTGGVYTSSDDCGSWVLQFIPPEGWIDSVRFGGSMFVAVGAKNGMSGTEGILYTSTDGVTWTLQATPPGASEYYNAGWDGTRWLVIGDSSSVPFFITSTDGVSWGTVDATGISSTFYTDCAIPGGPLWVVLTPTGGGSLHNWATAPEVGEPWTQRDVVDVATNLYLTGVWAGAQYVIAGYKGAPAVGGVATSADGLAWTPQVTPLVPVVDMMSAVAYNGSRYVVVGYDNTTRTGVMIYSSDGTATVWLAGAIPTDCGYLDLVWNGTVFVAVGLPPL